MENNGKDLIECLKMIRKLVESNKGFLWASAGIIPRLESFDERDFTASLYFLISSKRASSLNPAHLVSSAAAFSASKASAGDTVASSMFVAFNYVLDGPLLSKISRQKIQKKACWGTAQHIDLDEGGIEESCQAAGLIYA